MSVDVGLYYINLKHRTDRRTFMEAQFERLGLTVERIEAVTPADLTEAQIRDNCLPYRRLGRAPAEVACSLSHIEAWRRFAASGREVCVILEDDALLSSQMPALLDELANGLTGGVIKLDAMDHPLRLAEAHRSLGQHFAVRRLYTCTSRATAYALDRPTAEEMLVRYEFLHIPVDLVVFNPYGPLKGRIQVNQLTPAIAVCLELAGRPQVGVDPSLLSNWTRGSVAASNLEQDLVAREKSLLKNLRFADRVLMLRSALAEEFISGPSKFMQDYFWGVKKHTVRFVP
ncbi:glycosyltransferase family 25 protein [Arsenicitalea aurantiaca]|uniref:Glycosyltransferase family 25 protein n=1 Tax=Arsenicitalea aurantiaca TaxID=1783274 RepID=A0A433XLU1_9HYPH|nr:glycosyltransferase family 25 protein [Arsenicitalea aurantiaca]RUT35023.1 glycosyltransferase family 25 protein [Arsenicitalea aurantiaca]